MALSTPVGAAIASCQNPDKEIGPMRLRWKVDDDELRIPLEEAEWWGASLAVLISAIHHPGLLAASQPDSDPADVAREVLADLGELHAAGACTHARADDVDDEGCDGYRTPSVRRDCDDIVVSPGGEIANLAWCLEIFASAVLEPTGACASIARGASAYAASAWSADIGKATGAL